MQDTGRGLRRQILVTPPVATKSFMVESVMSWGSKRVEREKIWSQRWQHKIPITYLQKMVIPKEHNFSSSWPGHFGELSGAAVTQHGLENGMPGSSGEQRPVAVAPWPLWKNCRDELDELWPHQVHIYLNSQVLFLGRQEGNTMPPFFALRPCGLFFNRSHEVRWVARLSLAFEVDQNLYVAVERADASWKSWEHKFCRATASDPVFVRNSPTFWVQASSPSPG